MEHKKQLVYYAVFVVTKYRSFEDAKTKAPELILAHLARSKELHQQGTLMMSGAFLNNPEEPLSTMAVLTSLAATEDYIHGNPFFINGMISKSYIREWANMFA